MRASKYEFKNPIDPSKTSGPWGFIMEILLMVLYEGAFLRCDKGSGAIKHHEITIGRLVLLYLKKIS